MNLLLTKPSVMKSSALPKFYFSAYPLKALNQPEAEKKSYLHIYTKPNGKIKYAESMKVLPMVNPYTQKDEARLAEVLQKQNQPDNIEERDSEWFASYE